MQIQHENNFLPTSKHQQAKVHCLPGIFCTTASFIIKILSSEIVSKWDAIWTPVATQWIAKDIPIHGSQSKQMKSAIHLFDKY